MTMIQISRPPWESLPLKRSPMLTIHFTRMEWILILAMKDVRIGKDHVCFLKLRLGMPPEISNADKKPPSSVNGRVRTNGHTLMWNQAIHPFPSRLGVSCPLGYSTYGHISDGTQCFAILDQSKKLAKDVCQESTDELRALTLPKPDLVQRLFSGMRYT